MKNKGSNDAMCLVYYSMYCGYVGVWVGRVSSDDLTFAAAITTHGQA